MTLNKPCNLQTAIALVQLGYTKPTSFIWDRHNPTTREDSGKPAKDSIKANACFSSCIPCGGAYWKLSQSKGNYDDTCCLRAPSNLQASIFLFKTSIKNIWGKQS